MTNTVCHGNKLKTSLAGRMPKKPGFLYTVIGIWNSPDAEVVFAGNMKHFKIKPNNNNNNNRCGSGTI